MEHFIKHTFWLLKVNSLLVEPFMIWSIYVSWYMHLLLIVYVIHWMWRRFCFQSLPPYRYWRQSRTHSRTYCNDSYDIPGKCPCVFQCSIITMFEIVVGNYIFLITLTPHIICELMLLFNWPCCLLDYDWQGTVYDVDVKFAIMFVQNWLRALKTYDRKFIVDSECLLSIFCGGYDQDVIRSLDCTPFAIQRNLGFHLIYPCAEWIGFIRNYQ